MKHLLPFLVLFYFSGCSFSAFASPLQDRHANTDRHYRDSLRKQIFEHGTASVDCYLAYPIGDSTIDTNFGNNRSELDILRRFLDYALKDTLVCVWQVYITGYSSLDGAATINDQLSRRRATRLLRYLEADYHISANYPVEIKSIGADWTRFRELIVASRYFWKEDALRIADSVDPHERKKLMISQLGGGDAHKRLYEDIYPRMRRVEIKIKYDMKCMKEKMLRAGLPPLSIHAVNVLKLKAMNRLPKKPRRTPLQPMLAIKTNLYAWTGMTSEFAPRRFMPNLGAEVFFARQWSAVASATYANWDYSGKHWGVSAYRVEPRLWLRPDGFYRYLYIGAYGQAGDFDDRHDNPLKGTTGTYYQTGLSVGYYLPLSRHWGVEAGIRGGYQNARCNLYTVEQDADYLDATHRRTRWGVMGIEMGVSYRW